jgi:hypothetical protein
MIRCGVQRTMRAMGDPFQDGLGRTAHAPMLPCSFAGVFPDHPIPPLDWTRSKKKLGGRKKKSPVARRPSTKKKGYILSFNHLPERDDPRKRSEWTNRLEIIETRLLYLISKVVRCKSFSTSRKGAPNSSNGFFLPPIPRDRARARETAENSLNSIQARYILF